MFKRLLAVFTATLLTIATFAFAAELREDHPSTYTVQKGDTLWDIAGRFLKKPWQWPEIWQANPQIKNPHRIYPGDVLSLSYVDGKPVLGINFNQPSMRTGEPIDTVPIAQIEAFLKQISIVDEVKSLPYVVGLEEDRLRTSTGQVVYVRGLTDAQRGQSVQIARPTGVYALGKVVKGHYTGGLTLLDYRGKPTQPLWNNYDRPDQALGKKLGYELMQQATGEVIQIQEEVVVVRIDAGRDVRVGDRILPPAPPYDAQFQPQPPATIPEAAEILTVADGLNAAGTYSVVALSVGAEDGLKNGATFSIWHEGDRNKADKVTERKLFDRQFKMPDDYVGQVMVFRTFNKISYGLVMSSIRPIRAGDLLKHPDANQ